MSNLKKTSNNSYASKPVPSPRSQQPVPTSRVKSSTSSAALIQRELLKNQKFGRQDDDDDDRDDEEDYPAPIRPKAPVSSARRSLNGTGRAPQLTNVNSSIPTLNSEEAKQEKNNSTNISGSDSKKSSAELKRSSLRKLNVGLKKGTLAKERWAILRKVSCVAAVRESRE